MKRLILALAATTAVVVLAQAKTPEAIAAAPVERDYGVMEIPADAHPNDVAAWQQDCSPADRETTRWSLRFGCGDRVACRNYVSVPGDGQDGRRLRCFDTLIHMLGGFVLDQEPHYAHDRTRWEEHPAGSGRYVERDGPLGYHVTWMQRTDGCKITVWGVLGPPKPGTPKYLAGSPSMRLPCPAADAGGGS